MPKIPRDLSGSNLSKLLLLYGFGITRQTGSHIRLMSKHTGVECHITIPNHSPLKIGTLSNILNDIADYLKCDKESLMQELFKK
ncbi:MAG: type II toxin-antitoxin system HicA family toxin [Nitrospirae bacterium]|nr:type II toxin-antitoxin system HicA family toxin [Nitrospirota bacterium]